MYEKMFLCLPNYNSLNANFSYLAALKLYVSLPSSFLKDMVSNRTLYATVLTTAASKLIQGLGIVVTRPINF